MTFINPFILRIILQRKRANYFSLHLYRRVENGSEMLVGQTVIQDSGTVEKMSVITSYLGMVQHWHGKESPVCYS